MDRIATGGAAANGQALTFSFTEAASSASVSAAAYAAVTDVLALVGCGQAMPLFLARPPPSFAAWEPLISVPEGGRAKLLTLPRRCS